jgi:ketosteroid isomerase-like protein
MRRTEPPPLTPLASAEDCEQQFYEALQQGDVDKLMAVWLDDEEIACVHPGGQRLVGPEAIRASFTTLLRGGGLDARADRVRRLALGESAVHHVLERVQALTSDGPRFAWVVATNVFVQSPLGWRMVVHHASPHSLARSASAAESGASGSSSLQRSAEDDMGDDFPTTLH